jgi:hypothetical protein
LREWNGLDVAGVPGYVVRAVKQRPVLLAVAVLVVLAAGSRSSGASTHERLAQCSPARVHYTPYPGGDERMYRIPWVRGTPSDLGLVGLLWYWPDEWKLQQVQRAVIFTGGVVPAGYSTKILWAFVAPSAKGRGGGRLIVQGERLDGRAKTWQQFAPIGYAGQRGAPSFASIIKLPAPGCWRLRLTAGDLRSTVVFRAVSGG